jgi:hypothetical protein
MIENMKALSPYPASGRPVAVPRLWGKLTAARLVQRHGNPSVYAQVTCFEGCEEGRTAATTGEEGEEA